MTATMQAPLQHGADEASAIYSPHVTNSAALNAQHGPENTPQRPQRGNWFSNLGIQVKIFSVVGLLAIVAIASTAVASMSVAQSGADIHALAETQASTVSPLGKIHQDEIKARLLISQFAIAPDVATQEKVMASLIETDQEVDDNIALIDDAMMMTAPEIWEPFKESWAQFKAMRDSELMPMARSGDLSSYQKAYDEFVGPWVAIMADTMDAADEGAIAYFADSAAESEAASNQAVTFVWIVLALGLAVALSLAFLVARAIRRPLERVRTSLVAMADRDLTVAVGVESRDEVGQMAAALSTAQSNMREVISAVVSSAQAVATSAEELSASTVQISSAAEETSAQAGVVSAASEEVSRNVQTVAAGSEQMDASIREIAQNANEAAKVASQAMSAADATNTTVSQLGVSSQEIGDVVETITSIAAQTNLLALNATIEAARAGEAGKGFAVVANEVKELAQETQRATENIVSRVDAIQADSESAAAAIGEITQIIASINDFQMTIASAVEEQTATTNEMSRNVSDAATGTGEIATNITGVATAADSTTQAVTQTRTAVDELARMSAELRTQVAAFVF